MSPQSDLPGAPSQPSELWQAQSPSTTSTGRSTAAGVGVRSRPWLRGELPPGMTVTLLGDLHTQKSPLTEPNLARRFSLWCTIEGEQSFRDDEVEEDPERSVGDVVPREELLVVLEHSRLARR